MREVESTSVHHFFLPVKQKHNKTTKQQAQVNYCLDWLQMSLRLSLTTVLRCLSSDEFRSVAFHSEKRAVSSQIISHDLSELVKSLRPYTLLPLRPKHNIALERSLDSILCGYWLLCLDEESFQIAKQGLGLGDLVRDLFCVWQLR